MKLRAIVLALALAACGQTGEQQDVPTAPAGPDPFNLNIEIGRYGAMLSQVHDQTFERPGSGEPEVTSPRELARRLRETVWEYNLERSRNCARGLYSKLPADPPMSRSGSRNLLRSNPRSKKSKAAAMRWVRK
ncbi:MAG: hypothetical protein R3C27_13460 [Hyphomonadaceae bacterium]